MSLERISIDKDKIPSMINEKINFFINVDEIRWRADLQTHIPQIYQVGCYSTQFFFSSVQDLFNHLDIPYIVCKHGNVLYPFQKLEKPFEAVFCYKNTYDWRIKDFDLIKNELSNMSLAEVSELWHEEPKLYVLLKKVFERAKNLSESTKSHIQNLGLLTSKEKHNIIADPNKNDSGMSLYNRRMS